MGAKNGHNHDVSEGGIMPLKICKRAGVIWLGLLLVDPLAIGAPHRAASQVVPPPAGGASAVSSLARVKAEGRKLHKYIEEGVYFGGEAGVTAHSLREVKHIYSNKDKIERILIELGDQQGQPLLQRASYFQVSVQKKPYRVVVDLSQMAASGVDEKKLVSLLKESPYVEKAQLYYDPVDTSISIQLDLKKSVELEVFQILSADKVSRIAIDLRAKEGNRL